MPVRDGVGYSPATPLKQFTLDRAAGAIIGKASQVAKKRRCTCFVLDMTSGPGVDPKGWEGSPLILASHVQHFQDRGLDVRYICVDRDHSHLHRLQALFAARFPRLRVACIDDQRSALAYVPVGALGLSYWDTTRYGDLDVQLLGEHGRRHRFLDILFSRECLAGFRQRRAGLSVPLITDYLQLTGKTHGYVMKYANWGWWSLGFASNLNEWPNLDRGFYDIRSERGQDLLRELTGGELPPANDDGNLLSPEHLG